MAELEASGGGAAIDRRWGFGLEPRKVSGRRASIDSGWGPAERGGAWGNIATKWSF